MKIFKDINAYMENSEPENRMRNEGFRILRLGKHLEKLPEKSVLKFRNAHRRDFFEIKVTTKENTIFAVGESIFDQSDSSITFVAPGQIFSMALEFEEESDENEGYVIAFKPSFFNPARQNYTILDEFPFFKTHLFPQHKLSLAHLNELLHISQIIHNEYKHDKPYSIEIIRRYLDIFLYTAKRITNEQETIISVNRFVLIAARYEQLIVTGGNKFYSISSYASMLNISSVYLSECVKKATGKSAKQILLDHKLITAKSLLQQSDNSVANIANDLGFSEVTNFIKFFKNQAGITPNQFRKLRS